MRSTTFGTAFSGLARPAAMPAWMPRLFFVLVHAAVLAIEAGCVWAGGTLVHSLLPPGDTLPDPSAMGAAYLAVTLLTGTSVALRGRVRRTGVLRTLGAIFVVGLMLPVPSLAPLP